VSAALERSYRRALRWYPAKWRNRNEDVVVGTLMDVAEQDGRTTPASGELANLRATGFAARLGPLGRIPAEVRERVAALTLGLGAAIAIVALIANIWQLKAEPMAALPYLTVGPFVGFSFIFYAVWVVALGAALLGARRVATVLVLAAIPISIAIKLADVRIERPPTTTTIILMASLSILAIIANPVGSRRGRIRVATSTVAWAAGIAGTIEYQKVTQGGAAGSTDWFIGPLSQWMQLAIPLVIILAIVLWRVSRTPWAPAILIAEIPIAAFSLLGWQNLTTIATTTVASILVAVALAPVILRAFGFRLTITRH
jgi:hypothetical protein